MIKSRVKNAITLMHTVVKPRPKGLSAPALALDWFRQQHHPKGGIRVYAESPEAYPEVTGYIVPTLLDYGERDLATRLTKWLLCIQRANGGFPSPEGTPYVFDSGQVMRGLLAMRTILPEVNDAIRRLADYLFSQMEDEGRGGFGKRYQGDVPEAVHLYVLPPFLEAADLLNRPDYREAALRCLEYYRTHPDFLQIKDLTHFLAYEIESLIDLGLPEVAMPILDKIESFQQPSGAIRGVEGKSWVCTPGLMQLAICWYKVGKHEPADRAVSWLENHQLGSGGFWGSYGWGATYFPHQQIAWAVKYYLDAHRRRVLAFFERNAGVFSSEIASSDGRLQALLSLISPKDKVVEVGCGKGRFLRGIREAIPKVSCTGVDISPALLAAIPEGIAALTGSLEVVPCSDSSFDMAFSVEAIEHSANPAAAVAELIRIVKPGGWIAIIDKQQSQWGRLKCPPWERWPEAQGLEKLLCRYCDNVSAETVGFDGKPAQDGLMMIWKGQKRSGLSGDRWSDLLISPAVQKKILSRISRNQLSEWAQEVILHTSPGEKVLEIGSGTGEISLQLACTGRQVTLLDIEEKNLEFSRDCARQLGVEVQTVLADASSALPFADGEFDCVWQSGLLEHFDQSQRIQLLKEWSRVASRRVISLVPHGACLAYRVGKALQENGGAWPYGLEHSITSLRQEFEAAGLSVEREYSVGVEHALEFLPKTNPLRKALQDWIRSDLTPDGCNQGYLLVTIAEKTGA